MDFPNPRAHKPCIGSSSVEVLSVLSALAGSTSIISAAWPAANRAIYVPFVVAAPFPVARLWWANGATATGNVDCGLFTSGGTKLVSTGSTAQAGTNAVQSVAAALLLTPGSYYMALVLSSTSGTVFRWSPPAASCQAAGMAQQATALPLPATATFASIASSYLPLFGFTSSAVI